MRVSQKYSILNYFLEIYDFKKILQKFQIWWNILVSDEVILFGPYSGATNLEK